MNLLSDVITYVRRIVKTPSNAELSDALIIDYINRFWIMDVDARIQLFDLKTTYGFWTTPGVTSYNMPLYGVGQFPTQVEQGGPTIGSYPVYQGFMEPAYCNGIQLTFFTEKGPFYRLWPTYLQSLPNAGVGDGTNSEYTLQLPAFPALRGHVDITGIIESGSTIDPIVGTQWGYQGSTLLPNGSPPLTSVFPAVTITAMNAANQVLVVTDSGQFSSSDITTGFLQTQNPASPQQLVAAGTVNYNTGEITVDFGDVIPAGNSIQVSCYFYQQGIARSVLFYNNVLTVQPPPDVPYYIELDAYLSPAAFLNSSSALQFGYMAEYLARGAARKIMSDTGDVEQFSFYEPLFKEQETLVWKRSQRQFTSTRTQTIFSEYNQQNTNNSTMGLT